MFGKVKVKVFLMMSAFLQVQVSEQGLKSRGKIEGKIIGGELVSLEKFPFAVQFFNMGALCGGVIVTSWSILTSAHCFDNNKNENEMSVQIGSRLVYDFNAKRYTVSYYVIHKDYNKELRFQCDIAIVFTEKQMTLGELAKKAILVDHDRWMNKEETQFYVVGWGWTKYGGPISDLGLMMTSLKFVPLDECSRLHKVRLTEDMFCLYGEGMRDTCKGDSGGGVLWNGVLVGLTSHGDGCARKNKPSVYTNVWYMRPWVKIQLFKHIINTCKRITK